MPVLTVDGVDLVYETHGDDHAEPLVLIHGFTGSRLDWSDVVGPLAEHRSVVAYDHRGHGESGHGGDYTIDRLLADLVALLDHLGLARVHLLGHSMGGVVAQRFTLDHPERVRSLVLMDTAPEATFGPRDVMRAGISLVEAQGTEVLIPMFTAGLADDARGAEIRQRITTKLTQMDPAAFAGFGEQLLSVPSMVSRLSEIGAPTTVIVGEDDHALRPAAELLARGIPGATLVVVTGAAHSPQEEATDAWLAAVEHHLRYADQEIR